MLPLNNATCHRTINLPRCCGGAHMPQCVDDAPMRCLQKPGAIKRCAGCNMNCSADCSARAARPRHKTLARPLAPPPDGSLFGGMEPSRWGCHAGSLLSAGERDAQTSVRREGPCAIKAAAVDSTRPSPFCPDSNSMSSTGERCLASVNTAVEMRMLSTECDRSKEHGLRRPRQRDQMTDPRCAAACDERNEDAPHL